jgi:hypothetical protein
MNFRWLQTSRLRFVTFARAPPLSLLAVPNTVKMNLQFVLLIAMLFEHARCICQPPAGVSVFGVEDLSSAGTGFCLTSNTGLVTVRCFVISLIVLRRCCPVNGDNNAQMEVAQLGGQVDGLCSLLLTAILCSRCLSDSATIYAAVTTRMPNLCTADCESLFSACSSTLITHAPWTTVATATTLSALFGSADGFCSAFSTVSGTCWSQNGISNFLRCAFVS